GVRRVVARKGVRIVGEFVSHVRHLAGELLRHIAGVGNREIATNHQDEWRILGKFFPELPDQNGKVASHAAGDVAHEGDFSLNLHAEELGSAAAAATSSTAEHSAAAVSLGLARAAAGSQ